MNKKPLKEIVCKNCGNVFKVKPSKKREYCSVVCAQNYKSVNKDWLLKRNETNLKKYGVKSPLESDIVKEKYKSNFLKNHGVINPFLSPLYKEKAKQSIIDRYGVDVASKNQYVKDKISKSLKYKEKDKFNFINIKWEKILSYCSTSNLLPLFNKMDLNNNLNNVKFKFECALCSNVTEVSLDNGYLPSCNCSDYKGYSLIEEEIYNFINSIYDKPIYLKNRDILPNRLELDIYLPEDKIAIEINGIYWHSESMGKYKDYHLYKTNKCLEKQINLIHIFDYEWLNKQDIIKSILLNKLNKTPNKIYARKCEIKEISNFIQLKEFLNKNHLQGYCHSKINLGLYYNNELVSVMTFGKYRFKKDTNNIEMIRFCNKLNTNVIGGASKLFSYFIKHYNNNQKNNIISFADRRFSNGNLYNILGFDVVNIISPSYFYWKDKNILHRMSCQKHKLHKILNIFDKNESEYQNMLNNGYKRVWDCGNFKFSFK